MLYTFAKHIGIIEAFQEYLRKELPSCNGVSGSPDEVMVEFSKELSAEEIAHLNTLVATYNDPSYWLYFDHTENMFMSTHYTSSTTPTLLESFIISPYETNNIVLGDIKTIVQIVPNEHTLQHFSTWDSNMDPVSVTLEIFDYTDKTHLIENSLNLNYAVAQEWIPLIQAGSNVLPTIAKTIQLYGLKDENPGSDCIWQFHGHISNSNLSFNFSGLQKIYYQILLPK